MVRRYCDPNEQINYLGRPNRASMTHLSREGVRSFAMPNRASSPSHQDSEDERAGNPPTRRRIALAVRNSLCFWILTMHLHIDELTPPVTVFTLSQKEDQVQWRWWQRSRLPELQKCWNRARNMSIFEGKVNVSVYMGF